MLAVALAAAGCTAEQAPDARPSSTPGSPAAESADLPGAPSPAERGAIVSRSPMTVDPGGPLADVSVTRVVYRSSAGYAPGDPDGTFGTQVSGIVAAPSGTPPPGGWPIVAYGHGTTGTASNCGPSGYPDLLGGASTIASLVNRGYVVAASDYQGLSGPGASADARVTTVPHPYLDTDTVARNMIDMVRAARTIVPQAGTRWASMGASQGGQAAWAAGEAAATDYGSGLRFVGAAALAPAADVSPIADGYDAQPYAAPTFTQIQIAFIPLIVDGLRAVYPDLPVDQYMRGGLAAGAQALTSCGSGSAFSKYSALTGVRPGDAAIRSASALRQLHSMLAADALPQRRSDAPLFVGYGDSDQIITPSWTAGAVTRACAMGDTIERTVAVGKGHTNTGLTPSAIDWIGDRFAGDPAPNTCPR
ncbi:lipase family protein [Williamsia sp. MIQD14]|uniref:lipase family protein n=1 Tax=Williamsia sp. MIQD14 TaxID=3425703 RepID=UPI003DA07C0E